jgi:hypothetical protein
MLRAAGWLGSVSDNSLRKHKVRGAGVEIWRVDNRMQKREGSVAVDRRSRRMLRRIRWGGASGYGVACSSGTGRTSVSSVMVTTFFQPAFVVDSAALRRVAEVVGLRGW